MACPTCRRQLERIMPGTLHDAARGSVQYKCNRTPFGLAAADILCPFGGHKWKHLHISTHICKRHRAMIAAPEPLTSPCPSSYLSSIWCGPWLTAVAAASGSLNLMKPNPRGCRVRRSFITTWAEHRVEYCILSVVLSSLISAGVEQGKPGGGVRAGVARNS